MKIILSRKETARFVAGKAYRYFINQENPDPDVIEHLGNVFYDADYEIAPLMKEIFSSDHFYDKRNVGNRIKSPIEFIVGLKKNFKVEFDQPKVILALQKLLGQVLFYPPNVSGWAGGRNWIDSSTLMYRMKIPEALFLNAEMDIAVKSDPMDTAMMEAANKRILKSMSNTTDIEYFSAKYAGKPVDETIDGLCTMLIAPGVTNINKPLVKDFIKDVNDPVRMAIMRITSMPEYQLC